jgi:hypothetical protein
VRAPQRWRPLAFNSNKDIGTIMSVSAQHVETIADTAGHSRETIRNTFAGISATLGDRQDSMQQRISGIMANACRSGAGNGGLDAVMDDIGNALSTRGKSRIFGTVGLGFIGGFLLAGAAGQIADILVGLLCLFGAGMLLLSYAKALIARLADSLDAS